MQSTEVGFQQQRQRLDCWMDPKAVLLLTLCKISLLFPGGAAPVCVPPNSTREFLLRGGAVLKRPLNSFLLGRRLGWVEGKGSRGLSCRTCSLPPPSSCVVQGGGWCSMNSCCNGPGMAFLTSHRPLGPLALTAHFPGMLQGMLSSLPSGKCAARSDLPYLAWPSWVLRGFSLLWVIFSHTKFCA